MRAYAIIGAGLGDEGKGAAVDALAASLPHPLVVRFNGGAQAGHTVVTPEGLRHVFSHFGSGALVGAPTYLSKYFVANPRCFINELAELVQYAPQSGREVFIDPLCQVTTPYDVMVNRWAENHRGANKHGSVGIGFGETIERGLNGPSLDLYSLASVTKDGLRGYLKKVRAWAECRLEQLSIQCEPHHKRSLKDESVVDDWIENFRNMVDKVTITTINHALKGHALKGHDSIIFEGAQGLLLDQKHGYTFPYLTRSNTGLTNVIELARVIDLADLEVRYITRAYSTRHGAGPLEGEVVKLDGITVNDTTNTTKPWQDHLRLAPLMVKRVSGAIYDDLSRWEGPTNLTWSVMLTCMDQVESLEHQFRIIKHMVRHGILPRYVSYGPTRIDHQQNMENKACLV